MNKIVIVITLSVAFSLSLLTYFCSPLIFKKEENDHQIVIYNDENVLETKKDNQEEKEEEKVLEQIKEKSVFFEKKILFFLLVIIIVIVIVIVIVLIIIVVIRNKKIYKERYEYTIKYLKKKGNLTPGFFKLINEKVKESIEKVCGKFNDFKEEDHYFLSSILLLIIYNLKKGKFEFPLEDNISTIETNFHNIIGNFNDYFFYKNDDGEEKIIEKYGSFDTFFSFLFSFILIEFFKFLNGVKLNDVKKIKELSKITIMKGDCNIMIRDGNENISRILKLDCDIVYKVLKDYIGKYGKKINLQLKETNKELMIELTEGEIEKKETILFESDEDYKALE